MDLRRIALLLGGEPCGRNRVLCPGPGHSKADRSLSIIFNGGAGPVVYSFAGDDWRACRDHVARLLGLPDWRPSQNFEERRHEATSTFHAKTEAETEAKNTRLARLSGMAALTLAGPLPSFT